MRSDLFDAAAARDAGIAAADAGAPEAWKADAREAVEWCARMRLAFTADDVVRRLESLGQLDGANPAALGPVMLGVARDGVIAKTGRHVPSRIARRHRDLVEWSAT